MIRLENLSKYYHNEGNVALGLRKVNLEFHLGELVTITGESGSGKSTLLNVISGIDSYEEGELYFNGQETSHYITEDWNEYRRDNIGFVFQDFNLIESYTVLENIQTALIINNVPFKDTKKIAMEILEKVGLKKHAKHKAAKLSGGEKQRLAIARAIAKDAPVIVADEPTGNLDYETGKQIMDLLKELSETKLVIVVTHNHDIVDKYATRVVRVFDGEIVEDRYKQKPNLEYKIEEKRVETNIIKKSLPFSLWNLKNQPKRTIFTFIVALLITIIIGLQYASFTTLRFNEGYSGSNRYFPHSPPERIVIKKRSGEELTDDDYSSILKMSNVDYIIKQDLVFTKSLNLYYEHRSTNDDGYHYDIRFYGYIHSIQSLNKNDLLLGRMPENDNEIVISKDPFSNLEIEDYLNKEYILYGPFNSNESKQYKVVGVSKYKDSTQNQIFFLDGALDELNKEFSSNAVDYKFYITASSSVAYFSKDVIDINKDSSLENINDIIIYVNRNHVNSFILSMQIDNLKGVLELNYQGKKLNVVDVQIDNNLSNNSIRLAVNPELYQQLVINPRMQASVMVKNTTRINQTIQDLKNKGYYAYNPTSSPKQKDLWSVVINIVFLVVFFINALLSYLFSSFIISRLYGAKVKDNLILSSIGLNHSSINLINIIEIVFHFVVSIILYIPANYILISQVEEFSEIFLGFHWYHYVFLFVINTILGISVSLRVNSRIKRKSILTALRNERV